MVEERTVKIGRVLVFTPSYDGTVPGEYLESAIETDRFARENKIHIEWITWPNTGAIDLTRSRSATEFLRQEDATHLIFIDSDMGKWDAGSFFRLITSDKPISGIPYLKKIPNPCFTHQMYTDEIGLTKEVCPETGFVKCLRIGTGFKPELEVLAVVAVGVGDRSIVHRDQIR